jgi:hypothetical protein
VAERLNRTLLEWARMMRLAAGLPKYLWAEAVSHAAFMKNSLPTSSITGGINLCKRATGKEPELTGLIPWGSRVWTIQKDAGKLESKAKEGQWVGFDSKTRGH